MAELTDREEKLLATPFGDPSAPYVLGTLRGKRVAFLSRHGAGHRLTPTELNYRANIFGMKLLGVEWILSASAVGSLQEQYRPMDLVFPDQFIDRTRGRDQHVLRQRHRRARRLCASAVPGARRTLAADCAEQAGARVHRGGTYVCMEGPQFSTLAESKLYRSWGADIIGMTNLQEAKLAREAEIAYSTMALVTDYDCWHPDHDSVTVEMIIGNLTQNAKMAQQVIAGVVERLDVDAARSLRTARWPTASSRGPTPFPSRPSATWRPIIGKYVK